MLEKNREAKSALSYALDAAAPCHRGMVKVVEDVLLWLVWLGLGWLLVKNKRTKSELSFALDAAAPCHRAMVEVTDDARVTCNGVIAGE